MLRGGSSIGDGGGKGVDAWIKAQAMQGSIYRRCDLNGVL